LNQSGRGAIQHGDSSQHAADAKEKNESQKHRAKERFIGLSIIT
tara:strand:+ start:83 stop:214 length:132 start_codon:yes stop_codon:yes gene_type:complete